MSQTTITVTAKHIKRGIATNCRRCPAALALREARPDLDFQVDQNDILIRRHGSDRLLDRQLTPLSVRWFIDRFDRDDAVEPFCFQIELPEPITP
jgi:hypothetical protein